MLNKSMRNGIILMLMTLITLPLMAQDSGKEVYIHGLVSRGYLKSSGNNYLAEDSKDGCFAYGEATINFTTMPMEKLRIGAQLYGRDLDADGNFYVIVDLAYGDYRWNDFMGFRVGRFKNPMGLYGKVRDIDMARVPVFLPQSTYGESERDMNLAVDGVGVYGSLNTGSLGEFEYEAVYGSYNIFEHQSSFFRNSYYKTAVPIAAGMAMNPAVNSAELLGTSDAEVVIENIRGFNITWHTPLNGLKLGTSFNAMDFFCDFNADLILVVPTGDPANPTFTMEQSVPVHNDYDITTNAFFGEFQLSNLTLAAEYRKYDIDGFLTIGGNASDVNSPREMYWGMGSYRFNSWLSFSSYYSVFYANSDDKDGAELVAQGKPDFYAWQKDLCFSTRFDLTPNWLMKVEYHNINGTGQVSELYNPEGFEENWGLLVAKSTFHF